MRYSTYQEQLQHPKWKKLAENLKEKSNWKCLKCQSIDKPLIVHHKTYVRGRKAWQYNESLLEVICEDCHKKEHQCKWCKNIPKCSDANLCPVQSGNYCMRCTDKVEDLISVIGPRLCGDCEALNG